MQRKKVMTLILLVLGVAIMIAGVAILARNGMHHTGNGGGIFRASTSAKYGADFYTDSVQATGLAANAVIDLYQMLSVAIGIFFLFIGGVDIAATLLLADVKALFQKEPPESGAPMTEASTPPMPEPRE